MDKKKVIVITETLPHYRVGLYGLLTEEYDLTIAHSGEQVENENFKQIEITKKSIGPFFSFKQLPQLEKFDVVIFTFNIRILNCYRIIFSKRKFKLLFHGIGVSASYKNLYDQDKLLDWIRKMFIKKSDGVIFYEHYPLIKYQSFKIDSSKLHVAYNTVMSPDAFDFNNKAYESFIFIGALYKQKKIYDLLEAYLVLYGQSNNDCPKLEIVGNGDEYDNILLWIRKNKLEKRVILHGEITDNHKLESIFLRAIATISPGQAGLSVQKSFSFGVPYVTSKEAITGGELFSIIDNVNGFLYDGKISNLTSILIKISSNKFDIKEISKNAFVFYQNFRTPKIWLSGYIKAIESTYV